MTLLNKSSFEWQESFKEIQSYQNNEVSVVLNRLLLNKRFIEVLTNLFSSFNTKIENRLNTLSKATKISELQDWVEAEIFPLIAQRYKNFSITGLSELDASKSYIFISNHRDIVMDPLLLNKALRTNSFTTANCAIGDNLLQDSSANDLALLNRCFKIFRSIKSPRAILKAMKNQSAYIQYLHFNKQENIWIAQKEGRAKDNIDKTNPALIKMLALAKPKELIIGDYLSQLNIVPVCFSYEWDPCDTDKATELNAQNENVNYTKNKLDDFIATKKGLEGNKGNIHIHFGSVLSSSSMPNNDLTELNHKTAAEIIDQSILNNYQFFPVNYAAYKKLHRELPSNCPFTKQEINNATKTLEERVLNESVEIAKRVYKAYAHAITYQL